MSGSPTFDTEKKGGEFKTPPRPTGRWSKTIFFRNDIVKYAAIANIVLTFALLGIKCSPS